MSQRPMRRKDRQLPQEEAWALIEKGGHGALSVTGDGGWPYGVPMNFITLDGCLYLHCAREGHKLDSIARDDRVCFTVVTKAQPVPEHITTLYESVIVFGRASLVEEEDQRLAVLDQLISDLGQVSPALKARYIQAKQAKTGLIRIQPVQVTGKASRNYVPVEKRM